MSDAFSLKAAGKFLGDVSERTVRREISAGRITPVRVRRRVTITRAELERYQRENLACQSDATDEAGRYDLPSLGDPLAELLEHRRQMRKAGSGAPAKGSNVVPLDSRRVTQSAKR